MGAANDMEAWLQTQSRSAEYEKQQAELGESIGRYPAEHCV